MSEVLDMMLAQDDETWVAILQTGAVKLDDGRYAQIRILGHTHNALIVRGTGEVVWVPKEQTEEEE